MLYEEFNHYIVAMYIFYKYISTKENYCKKQSKADYHTCNKGYGR